MENPNAQRSSLITYSHHLLPCGPPSFFMTVDPQKENKSAVTKNTHVGKAVLKTISNAEGTKSLQTFFFFNRRS